MKLTALTGSVSALGVAVLIITLQAAVPATQPAVVPTTQPSSRPAATQPATRPVVRVIYSGTGPADGAVVDPRAPINGRVVPTGPSATIGEPPNGSAKNAAGQTLTNTFPPGDRFQVFKDNRWIGAQVLQRSGGRALVRFDGYPESANEWVTPNQVK